MLNIKHFAIAFIIGFFLSLFSGLIGGVSFGTVLLRAILSGALFSVLAFGAMNVYKMFLVTGDSLETSSTENQSDTASAHTVDIVVDDDLPDSATAPSFNLSNYVQSPDETNNAEELEEVEDIQSSDSAGGEFQTSSLATMTASPPTAVEDAEVLEDSEEETERVGTIPKFSASSPGNSELKTALLNDDSESELGVLPDIESLGIEEEATPQDADELIQDSVFAETGEVKPLAPTVAPSEMGDAKEIAAAIRTALVKDT